MSTRQHVSNFVLDEHRYILPGFVPEPRNKLNIARAEYVEDGTRLKNDIVRLEADVVKHQNAAAGATADATASIQRIRAQLDDEVAKEQQAGILTQSSSKNINIELNSHADKIGR